MKKILPIFSYIFHPIFIPILGTFFYLKFDDGTITPFQGFLLLFQIVIITFLLPLAFFYMLRTFGKVDNIMLSETSQRKIPLLLQMVLTIVLLKQSVTIERFPELFYFFLGGLISTMIAFALLFPKVKSSIHMIGISAVTFFVIGLSLHTQINSVFLIAALFILNGLIASSRLAMKAHTMKELAIGFTIGILPQLFLWNYWL